MKITIFGAGYVGLVTGACLADVGHAVTLVDVDAKKIAGLNQAKVPIFEPGLEDLVEANLKAGRMHFTTDAAAAIGTGELIFIAVGTPPGEDGSADLKYVLAVAATIGQHIDGYKIVINKSTVPVGTGDKVRAVIEATLAQRGAELAFDVCSNPEFLKEGAAIEDFTKGARIVVGTSSERVREKMRDCYAPYNRNHDKLMFMDLRAAELTKYAANAMLATRISFINEIANLAEKLGVDIAQVRQGIGSDPRIGFHFIYPGAGYGGSCFPKDVQALIHMAGDAGVDARLLNSVHAVNERQKSKLFEKLERALGDVRGKTIAVWGLSFKPNTDDLREAPSETLIRAIWAAGGQVRAFDPVAMHEAEKLYGPRPDLTFAPTREAAVEGADALVICTEWKAFRTVDFAWLKATLSQPIVIDGRNLFELDELAEHGIYYDGIGRQNLIAL